VCSQITTFFLPCQGVFSFRLGNALNPTTVVADEFQSDRATKLKIVERLKVHGVFKAGIKFYPSLAHTLEDVTMTLKAFELAVGDVLEGRELDN
jgi:hypothetical protein